MRRDPLRALGELRNRQVDECAAKLAASVEAVDRASQRRWVEERARAREHEQNHRVDRVERRRLDSGCARVSDLERAAEFVTGARFREEEIERRLRDAEERERRALREHERARRDLDDAEAARVALERYGERQRLDERKRSERRADDEAMDRYNRREQKVQH